MADIPFGVASRLCTRFPTRIISRRTPGIREATKISIEPRGFSAFDDANYAPRRDKYEAFNRTVPAMTASEFKSVVEDVSIEKLLIVSFNLIHCHGNRCDGHPDVKFRQHS